MTTERQSDDSPMLDFMPVKINRKAWRELNELVASLQEQVATLQEHTHEYRAPGPLRTVGNHVGEPLDKNWEPLKMKNEQQ